MGIGKRGSCGLVSWLPSKSPKMDTYNKTRTPTWIKLQTFLTGNVIASRFMQAISLLKKYLRMEIYRKVHIIMSKRKMCVSSFAIFYRESLFAFLLKTGGRVRLETTEGQPAGRDGIISSAPSSMPSPCHSVRVVKYGKAKGKSASPRNNLAALQEFRSEFSRRM